MTARLRPAALALLFLVGLGTGAAEAGGGRQKGVRPQRSAADKQRHKVGRLAHDRSFRFGRGTEQLQEAKETRSPEAAIKGLRNLVQSARLELKLIGRKPAAERDKLSRRVSRLKETIAKHEALIAEIQAAGQPTLFDGYRAAIQKQDAAWFSFKNDTAIEFRVSALKKALEKFEFGYIETEQTLGELETVVTEFRDSMVKYADAGGLADQVTRHADGRMLSPKEMSKRVRELTRAPESRWWDKI